MKPSIDPANCIVVQESSGATGAQQHADQPRDGANQLLPTEESLLTSSTAQDPNNPHITTAHQQHHRMLQSQFHDPQQPPTQQQSQQNLDTLGAGGGGPMLATSPQKYPQLVELREFNEVYHATIPPYQFWSSEFRNKHPAFIRINFTLPWGATFAVYGRRNVAPSVTQYDFVEFIRGGRVENRLRRRRRRDVNWETVDDQLGNGLELNGMEEDDGQPEDYWQTTWNAFGGAASDGSSSEEEEEETELDEDLEEGAAPGMDLVKRRKKRSDMSMNTMMVNVSLLQYLDTGKWFLSVYNDELLAHSITLVVTEAEGVSTTCPNDCSGRGSCYVGKCDCIDGYQGVDCSKSKCRIEAREGEGEEEGQTECLCVLIGHIFHVSINVSN